ncbi:MAG: STAS domain-containing protein [Myxococcota bacterium]|nr:STAS domain-containing protein [Myxococcota bacterium]
MTPDPATPPLTDALRAALAEYFEFTQRHRAEVDAAIQQVLLTLPEFNEVLRRMTPAQLAEQQTQSQRLQRLALVEGDWSPYLEDVRKQGALYAQGGLSFGTWMQLMLQIRAVMRRKFFEQLPDREALSRMLDAMNLVIDTTMAVLGEAYLGAKEKIIGHQQEAIRELSTPVLQVHDRLLIVPVVGMVDTRRARHLTESMLKAIRDRRARAVVMDITGVPIVDSKVANHLAQACEAGRLMGARVILTGVSAEIAQALVTLGAELRGVETLGDLQSGIESAEHQLGYRLERGLPVPPSAPLVPGAP